MPSPVTSSEGSSAEDRPQSAEGFGAAVGAAATMTCGPSWTDAADLRLLADGAIARTTQQFVSGVVDSAPVAPGADRVRADDLERAREAAQLIEDRGYARGRDLAGSLDALVSETG